MRVFKSIDSGIVLLLVARTEAEAKKFAVEAAAAFGTKFTGKLAEVKTNTQSSHVLHVRPKDG